MADGKYAAICVGRGARDYAIKCGGPARPRGEVTTEMTPEELAKKRRAHFQSSEFKKLTLATKEQLEELMPQNNELCHDLAKRWVTLHPEHRVVQGFLVINEYLFHKHSVVDTGSLFLDVTPRPENESQRCLKNFIVCDGVNRPIFDESDASVNLLDG